MRATVYASSFAATLEMVREGTMELQQHAAFAPLYVRKRTPMTRHEQPASTARRKQPTQ